MEARPMSSRQSDWARKQIAAGRCRQCGELRGTSLSVSFCTPCLERGRATNRKRKGLRPWTAKGPGRPPLEKRPR